MQNQISTSGFNVFWFRRDLRLEDNVGLRELIKKRRKEEVNSGGPILFLFIFDTNILDRLKSKKDRRVEFIHKALQDINAHLESKGSALCVEYGDPVDVFSKLTALHKIQAVYTNEDYEPYARQRDKAVEKLLYDKAITFKSFKDQCIFNPLEVLKADDKPYLVFTPYKRAWISRLEENPIRLSEETLNQDDLVLTSDFKFNSLPSIEEIGFEASGQPFPERIVKKKQIEQYHLQRDFPYLDATSRLSVHLRFGTVSVRKVVLAARKLNETWLSELIWREFFMQILWHFPHVVERCFRPEFDRIEWRNDETEFKRWCDGQTGYPLVDAGMRELNKTGFMHNRVRMVVASFLTKHLLIDWKWGERYFAEKLLDYDFSANNGNWQWAAGCGCDAAPYFRIFNPEAQQKKFDPNQEYISRWLPPSETSSPIVDHAFARARALKTFEKALKRV